MIMWNLFATFAITRVLGPAYYEFDEIDSERYREFRRVADKHPTIKTYLFKLLDTQKEITYGNYEDVCVWLYLSKEAV